MKIRYNFVVECEKMNVKEAVKAAKNYILEVFADEQISDLGLEEVEFEDEMRCWHITIGFSRPWNRSASNSNFVEEKLELLERMRRTALRRSYKVVTIKDGTGEVISVTNRELQAS